LFILAIAMLIALAACNSATTPPSQGNSQTTSQAPPDNNQAPSQAPPDNSQAPSQAPPDNSQAPSQAPPSTAAKQGGTLRIGMNTEVAASAAWRLRSPQDVLNWSAVYETLMRNDSSGKIVPYLAESLTADEAALTYTVKLRDDVYFSDGSKLDADVLLWNFENFKDNSQTSSTHFGDVESFEKIDDLTVVLHLSNWSTQIPFSLGNVPGLMYSKKAFDDHGYDWCMDNPVGTGPYVLKEWVKDSYKVLEKNENYWNKSKPPILDAIRFDIISDEMSAQAALLGGQIDAFYAGGFAFQNTMKQNGFDTVYNNSQYRVYFLIYGSDVAGSPLTDVRVRQAIAYAIDSDTIAATVDSGMSFVSNQYAVEGTPFYNPDVSGYGYDPDKAKQLLADAGYPNGFTTKLSTGTDQMLDRYMVAIQGYLADVGITLNLDYQETSIWVSKGIYETDEGMILAGHGFGDNLVNQAVSNFSKRAIEGVGMLKNSMLHPDDLDTVLMNALRASNTDKMLEYMHEAERLIIDVYCLGYPVVLGKTGALTKAANVIDDGCIVSNNNYFDFTSIYFAG